MLITDACGWDVEPCECAALTTLEAENAALAAQVEAMAARHLFRWTGSRFGPCPVTVRPCRSDCGGGQILNTGGSGTPVFWSGPGCGCSAPDSCSCARVCQIQLDGPIYSVDEVWIDGVELDSSAYRVDNSRFLVRIDGECWPECNDLSVAHSVEAGGPSPEAVLGTWAVVYRKGLPIPAGGPMVAGILACEIAKAVCKDASCALPKRVSSITREGVTIAMLDDFTGLGNGKTGLWVIDSWIDTNRPRAQHAKVWSPDLRQRPRVVGDVAP